MYKPDIKVVIVNVLSTFGMYKPDIKVVIVNSQGIGTYHCQGGMVIISHGVVYC